MGVFSKYKIVLNDTDWKFVYKTSVRKHLSDEIAVIDPMIFIANIILFFNLQLEDKLILIL